MHPPLTPASKPLILVVDDTPEIRSVLNLRLSAHGFQVMEACNGKEGVEMAEKFAPDIVVSDFMMPEMNGIDSAAIIKWKPHTKNIPIIMLSSFPFGRDMILQMNDIGIDAYMMKPYEFDELLAKIREILQSRKKDPEKPATADDKRKSKRFQSVTLAQVEIRGVSFITQLQNISCEGLSLLLPKREPIGTVLTIYINPEASDEKDQYTPADGENAPKVLGKAKIMWIQPQKENQFLAGVEMLSLEL